MKSKYAKAVSGTPISWLLRIRNAQSIYELDIAYEKTKATDASGKTRRKWDAAYVVMKTVLEQKENRDGKA